MAPRGVQVTTIQRKIAQTRQCLAYSHTKAELARNGQALCIALLSLCVVLHGVHDAAQVVQNHAHRRPRSQSLPHRDCLLKEGSRARSVVTLAEGSHGEIIARGAHYSDLVTQLLA